MFNDPTITKLIIFALAGMVAVLGIAVIVLAVKKNTYYVDEDGEEIAPAKHVKKLKPVVDEEEDEEPEIIRPVQPVQPITSIDSLQPLKQTAEPAEDPFAGIEEETAAEKAPAAPVHTIEVPLRARPSVLRGVLLRVKIGNEVEETEVTHFPCLMGRDSSSCTLAVAEPAVSRRHARFYIEDGSLYLEDVSEHNGTYLNGVKLPPLGRGKVHEGDQVNLGRAEIIVEKFIY